MVSRPKRKRKSTDSQPGEMPAVATTDIIQLKSPSSAQDAESMVRSCMAAIIPSIEQNCREIITRQTELPSTATRSGPVSTVTASSIQEDASAVWSHDDIQPAQSLLQDITNISSSLWTSRVPEQVHLQLYSLLELMINYGQKFMLENILGFHRYNPLTPTRQPKLAIRSYINCSVSSIFSGKYA